MPRISRKANAVNNTAASPHIYHAAVYVRLSVEDMRKKNSGSVESQKNLLLDYLQTQPDIKLCGIYEDINYTGTNFNRPEFIRMIGDIKSRAVNCVIVKDLSRFGRNFSETGHYLERVFPSLGVRFISVCDNYDSFENDLTGGGLIVPLKNLFNEIYARDISKKIKAGKKAKRGRGEFCGSFAPYGYIKHGASLTADEEAAQIVRRIFGFALDGAGDNFIARKLNAANIHPPSRYRFEKGITKAQKHKEAVIWHKSAVARIIENPVYTGVMAGQNQNTHEAIICKNIFEAVRELRVSRKHRSEAANE